MVKPRYTTVRKHPRSNLVNTKNVKKHDRRLRVQLFKGFRKYELSLNDKHVLATNHVEDLDNYLKNNGLKKYVNKKRELREGINLPDSDGDSVPDSEDCEPNNPNAQDSVNELGEKFFKGVTSGVTSKMPSGVKRDEIIDLENFTALVGFGWAVYAVREKKSGTVTYYSGWYGYSPTTSKHISQLGLNTDDVIKVDSSPELKDLTSTKSGDGKLIN